ncbi:hypothetical protein K2173_006724 [Erythroxylum novogranatense]|uniref:Cellulose synthase-like protein H1 n=1 Tax=Erythroxylum novogranatense TaxID=1862640 RepID=A0AAV8TD11_9ROSI|nr:hypothetical protein K2173_006724 [Erythroxylum novogranatense]
MADTVPLPLYETVTIRMPIRRASEIGILLLLITLLAYRILSLTDYGLAWLLALLCESFFTLLWVATISTKWTPVEYKTYPERLSQSVQELPPVDMFVTTADHVLEPPIITVNTVLSLLAVDYPAHKLACYVSDDGCSPVTCYSLVEASKFAKLWVPFCKKYKIPVRAPFRYFSNIDHTSSGDGSIEFQRERKKMKDEYDELCRKIKDKSSGSWDLNGDYSVFHNTERRNHPTIIKVICENKGGVAEELPHLVYISREKQPHHPHHYKAGAMNVLTRVSGLMTNAPFMLNVDCDMYVNNPKVIRHAMCLFLGSNDEMETGFVQCPQIFYDGIKDDPFGNQLTVLHKYLGSGIVGIQGPFYGGTGCFHRRKIIYGLCPTDIGKQVSPVHANLNQKELLKIYGNSKLFTKSAACALQGKIHGFRFSNLSDLAAAEAGVVAACTYEHGTGWGTQVGLQYGTATEDVMTGLVIQSRGWKSRFCSPQPPAFLGCAPEGGPESFVQQKRWATGLTETLVSRRSPIFGAIYGGLQLRQCVAYLWVLLWALRSIPELCYASLPPYCILTNSAFLPKVGEAGMYIYAALCTVYAFYTLSEYLETGLSAREWWNNQRMGRINATNAWFFGLVSVVLKILGIAEPGFEVTQKNERSSDISDVDAGRGKFNFNESPIFLPGTTLVLVHFTAMAGGDRTGLGEWVFTVIVMICFWPFVRGLFRRGKYGIPMSTIYMSAVLTFIFVHLSKASIGWLRL